MPPVARTAEYWPGREEMLVAADLTEFMLSRRMSPGAEEAAAGGPSTLRRDSDRARAAAAAAAALAARLRSAFEVGARFEYVE